MTVNTLISLGNLMVTQEAPQQGGFMGILNMLLPFILIFGIFYFLVVLPQKKQQKKHAEMLSKLSKGDNVLMNCGIYGRVAEVLENDFKLEICQNPRVVITVQKGVVAGVVTKGAPEEKN